MCQFHFFLRRPFFIQPEAGSSHTTGSMTRMLKLEVRCGKRRRQVLTKKTNTWSKKDNITGAAAVQWSHVSNMSASATYDASCVSISLSSEFEANFWNVLNFGLPIWNSKPRNTVFWVEASPFKFSKFSSSLSQVGQLACCSAVTGTSKQTSDA